MIRLVPADARLRRIWGLYGVVVLLHAVLDPAVSYVAVRVADVAVETNPVLAPAFATGPAAVVVAQLPLFGIVIVGLGGLTALFNRASEREAAQLYRLSLLVLGGCALWGVILVGWNSWVLVSGL